jgi:hypothetical protein
LSFGSGDIVVAAATDIVRLGQESATMNKSLMLMVDRQLRMAQNFEGILGLGVPSEVEVEAPKALSGGVDPNGGNVPRKIKDKSSGNFSDPVPRFLEEAGINRFSICFNDNMEAGVMRLEPPKAPKMLKQVGFFHWAVELQGFPWARPVPHASGFAWTRQLRSGAIWPALQSLIQGLPS